MSTKSVAFVALMSVAISLVSAQDIIFPGETERPSRFPIVPPTTPSPDAPVREPATQAPAVVTITPPNTAAYIQCITDCRVTSEYNPVCATDNVVYSNPGRLSCANYCGNPAEFVRYGQCSNDTRG